MDYAVSIGIKDLFSGALGALNNKAISTTVRMKGAFDTMIGNKPFQSLNALQSKLQELYDKQGNAGDLKSLKAINKQIKEAEASMNRLQNAGNSQGGVGMLGKLKSDMMSLPGAAFMTNPIIAIGGALAGATSFAMDFEKGMAQVNATAQLSPEKLDIVKNKLVAMGKTSNVELGNMPAAFNKVLSAVGDVDKSMIIFEQTLKASKAGFTDVNITADAITNVMGSAGLKANQAGYAYDVLFKTMKTGKAEFQDIAAYLPKVLPAAMQVGVGFEQISGAFAYMTTKGQSAEQTTTLLQNAMKALANPDRIQDFKKLNIEIFDGAGKMRPLVNISKDLSKELDGLTDQQKIDKLAKLGLDTEASSAFALLSQDTASLGSIIGETSHATGELNNTLAFTKNKGDDLTSFMNSFKAIGLQVGTAILPILGTALTALSPMIEVIGNVITTSVVPQFSKIANLLGPVLMPIISFAGDYLGNIFAPILGFLGEILTFIMPLFEALGWILGNVIAPVFMFTGEIIKFFAEKVKDAFSLISPVIEFIKGMIADLIEGVKEALEFMGLLDESATKAAKNVGTSMGAAITTALPKTLSGLSIEPALAKPKEDKAAKGANFAFSGKDKKGGGGNDALKVGTGGVEGDKEKVRNLTVTFTNLVENIIVNSSNLTESTSKIRDEISKALIDAVRDFELIGGK